MAALAVLAALTALAAVVLALVVYVPTRLPPKTAPPGNVDALPGYSRKWESAATGDMSKQASAIPLIGAASEGAEVPSKSAPTEAAAGGAIDGADIFPTGRGDLDTCLRLSHCPSAGRRVICHEDTAIAFDPAEASATEEELAACGAVCDKGLGQFIQQMHVDAMPATVSQRLNAICAGSNSASFDQGFRSAG